LSKSVAQLKTHVGYLVFLLVCLR